ncbi:MMPL family transporter [Vibrio sp. 2026]|uniref:MMPL family transporter n=1 Tax=unclassified Vibrio TaxID=2614977 RepID=UPI0029642D76|nr:MULTISPECIES: MMPL family transporter [unclassified Vibrio]MDW1515862.1 MMPL family transporter [Vibrio sp. Vb5035]MDW1545798.1 MMPL family transporter [Vibrio sp. Vb5034]MDW1777615.1 MMPL family transporter [Vibrio sp. Vb2175]MDW1841160.1 MMPL family transporter [Vibrio sp. Vb0839]MDW1938162.1 MMPL family transporter [Vibrio sp. 818]
MPKTLNSVSKLSLGTHTFALVWLNLVVLAGALLLKQWVWSAESPIETNILKLLPKNQQNPVAEQAFESVSASMSDKVIFVITAPDKNALFAAATEFDKGLRQSNHFRDVVGKISPQEQQAWASYYFKHRFQLLTPEQRERLSKNPEQQVQHVIQSLYNPFSGVTGQELQNDPFLLFRDYLSQVTQQSSSFRLDNGYLSVEKDGAQYLLITAELKDSPYSLTGQLAVPDIQALEQSVAQKYGAKVAHTGVLFYADFGTQSAKSEISTIGVFSLLGIIALLVLVFRSVVPLSLALLSITIGLLVALSVTTWIFGKVHLFSLVFGASLIGVSIDYAFHYLTERLAAGNEWDSEQGLKHIFIAITLGLITSLIGYLGMLVAPFPGLQQLALFSSIGLIAAYITVVAWYPILARNPSRSISNLPGQSLLAKWLTLWNHPRIKVGLPMLCVVASGFFLLQLNYDDDIRLLQTMPNDLKQQETLITTLSGMQSSQQMLVVTADDDENLMKKLESLTPTLEAWKADSTIESYQSLSRYLSSVERQQQDYQLIRDLYATQSSPLTSGLGLSKKPKMDADFIPVTVEQYLQNPVSAPVRFLHLGKIKEKSATVVVLNQLQDSAVVKAFAKSQSDVVYLNKAEEISTLFGEYRIKIIELLAAASAVIFLVLIKRYGLQHSWRVLLPSLIACACGLATAVAMGTTLNLFNLLGLVLILGIGIDYTLFFAEKARSVSTLLAITLSAMTTVLSFGLLSLSQTHAIHSFGITVLSGIFVAWLLSPIAIKTEETTS